MIVGRYGNTTERPYIEAKVVFPRLIAASTGLPCSARISFLVDTGADLTTIMPVDVTRLSIDVLALKVPHQTTGVGGAAHGFKELAIVSFSEPGSFLHAYTIQMLILPSIKDNLHCPSLLGRDILKNWAITFDKPNDRLTAKVDKSDQRYAFTQKIAIDAVAEAANSPPYHD